MALERGVVYRTYESYGEWCYNSIVSLKLHGGVDVPIVVYDFNKQGNKWVDKIRALDGVEVRRVEYEGPYRSNRDREHRFAKLGDPDFDIELRLDADTMILGDVGALFETAEETGFAAVVDHYKPTCRCVRTNEGIKRVNGGVLCYDRATAKHIYRYVQTLRKMGKLDLAEDQPALNAALNALGFHGDEHLLPPRYNYPGMKNDTTISHLYSYAKQNKSLKAKFLRLGGINELRVLESGVSSVNLVTCVGVDFDLGYIQHFARHYERDGQIDRWFVLLQSNTGNRKAAEEARRLFLSVLPEEKVTFAEYFTEFYSREKIGRLNDMVELCPEGSWVLLLDIDEFVGCDRDWRLEAAELEGEGLCFAWGCWVDRLAMSLSPEDISADAPLSQQFPLETNFSRAMGFSVRKPVFFKSHLRLVSPHDLKLPGEAKGDRHRYKIDHYKWVSGTRAKLQRRARTYKGVYPWWRESEKALELFFRDAVVSDITIDLTGGGESRTSEEEEVFCFSPEGKKFVGGGKKIDFPRWFRKKMGKKTSYQTVSIKIAARDIDCIERVRQDGNLGLIDELVVTGLKDNRIPSALLVAIDKSRIKFRAS